MNLFLHDISLCNFRNYCGKDHRFHFHKKVIFIIGPNGIGKSNLLEAIQVISFSSENRAETEKQLICFKSQENFFQIEGNYSLGERNLKIEFRGGSPSVKNIKLNGVKYRSGSQFRDEALKVVSFGSRESLDIVRGSPSKRRDWLDTTLSLLDLRYGEGLRRYGRSLEQRNSLLRNYQEGRKTKNAVLQELDLWDSEISKYGFYVQTCRQRFLSSIQEAFNENCHKIAGSNPLLMAESCSLAYLPSIQNCLSVDDFSSALQRKRELDLIKGQTSIGPHRDDFMFLVLGQEARHFASQGQQRTCALAVKMVQLHKWKEKLKYSPILLLDDVASELDLGRQNGLFMNLPTDSQIFITTTHLINLPSIPNANYQILDLSKT